MFSEIKTPLETHTVHLIINFLTVKNKSEIAMTVEILFELLTFVTTSDDPYNFQILSKLNYPYRKEECVCRLSLIK